MKAFAWVTPNFSEIAQRHFFDSVPLSGLDLSLHQVDMPEVGEFDSPSMLALARQRDFAIRDLLRTETRPFLVTDCDIRFYGRVAEDLLAQLGDRDIVFQSDHPDGYPCMGFFVVRPNARTIAFMTAVLSECISSKVNDQVAARKVLEDNPVTWGYLDHRYWTAGRESSAWEVDSSGLRVWKPGMPLNPPPDMLVHHGNWTIGLANKMALLDAVKEMPINNDNTQDPTIEDARSWLLASHPYLEEKYLATLAAYPTAPGPYVTFEYRDCFGCPIIVNFDRRSETWGAARVP